MYNYVPFCSVLAPALDYGPLSPSDARVKDFRCDENKMFGFGVLQEIRQQLVRTTSQDVVSFLGFASGATKTDAENVACAAGVFRVTYLIHRNPLKSLEPRHVQS